METTENLTCVFLEILASICGAQAVNHLNCYTDFGPNSRYLTGENAPLLHAANLLRDGLHESMRWHLQRTRSAHNSADYTKASDSCIGKLIGKGSHSEPLSCNIVSNMSASEDPATNPKALIQRHWYSTFRQMACDEAQGAPWLNCGFEVIRLPGAVWTRGDWHLAIVDGSVGVRTGVRMLLDEFLTRGSASARLVQGVGLPPHKVFYFGDSDCEPTSPMPVMRVGLAWFQPYVVGDETSVIYRSRICGYHEAAPVLAGFLHSIIASSDSDKDWLREQFSSLHDILQSFRRQ